MSLATVSLAKIRRVLLRHRGELARLADELGVTRTTVSAVLRGKATSARILEAALGRAQQLDPRLRQSEQ
jgi:transcriptional regulator with XRE-family HTH domain